MTDWQKVKGINEEEIKTSEKAAPDCQPAEDDIWDNATVVMPSNHQVSQ